MRRGCLLFAVYTKYEFDTVNQTLRADTDMDGTDSPVSLIADFAPINQLNNRLKRL